MIQHTNGDSAEAISYVCGQCRKDGCSDDLAFAVKRLGINQSGVSTSTLDDHIIHLIIPYIDPEMGPETA